MSGVQAGGLSSRPGNGVQADRVAEVRLIIPIAGGRTAACASPPVAEAPPGNVFRSLLSATVTPETVPGSGGQEEYAALVRLEGTLCIPLGAGWAEQFDVPLVEQGRSIVEREWEDAMLPLCMPDSLEDTVIEVEDSQVDDEPPPLVPPSTPPMADSCRSDELVCTYDQKPHWPKAAMERAQGQPGNSQDPGSAGTGGSQDPGSAGTGSSQGLMGQKRKEPPGDT